jgi:hypothetical protein
MRVIDGLVSPEVFDAAQSIFERMRSLGEGHPHPLLLGSRDDRPRSETKCAFCGCILSVRYD